MTEVFAVEKEEMENEYSTFATQYDELQVQINNDSLREKLESEKLKTQRLLEELRQVKSSNAAEIIRLKKELKTVRAVLRSYVMQIDSLNRLNAALMVENQEVKSKYTAATAQINTLAAEKKNLNERVSLAAQLDATNISALPMNKRGKKARKVKDVKRLLYHLPSSKTLRLRLVTRRFMCVSPNRTMKFYQKVIQHSNMKIARYLFNKEIY